MTFVGTRPEVEKYVEHYTDEMRATLLLPAGVTSEASIHYKDEEQLLADANDADATYLKVILPEKMKYNVESLEKFGFLNEVRTMVRTVNSVLR
jgi:lipopolysaccharide/colanic/teichoic acid biosynthesis glycosyltransferase